jgi:hypothetical protein
MPCGAVAGSVGETMGSRVIELSEKDKIRICRDHLSKLAMIHLRRMEKQCGIADDELLSKKCYFFYKVSDLIETNSELRKRVFKKALAKRLSDSCYIDY